MAQGRSIFALMSVTTTDPNDPVAILDRLDPEAIRTELDRLYEREAALRAAWRIVRARQRQREKSKPRRHTERSGELPKEGGERERQ